MKRWNKHVKMAVAAMVTAVAVMTPAVGLAAGDATLKKYCMEEANLIALQLNIPGEGHMNPAHVLAATAESMKKAGKKPEENEVTYTDTELLWVKKWKNPLTVEIKIYTGVRYVVVTAKQGMSYESARAKY